MYRCIDIDTMSREDAIKWLREDRSNDSLFVDDLTSDAYEEYKHKQQRIYKRRKGYDVCGKNCTLPQIWRWELNFPPRAVAVAIKFYLIKYFQRDNLFKLCVDYLFTHEPKLSHWTQHKKMLAVVDKIIGIVIEDKELVFDNDIEEALFS